MSLQGSFQLLLEKPKCGINRQPLFSRPNISEKGAMPMDFSWELLFELLGKVADTIGNVLGGTKKD